MRLLVSSLLIFCSLQAVSQADSIVLKDNTLIVGELQSMNRGVLVFETSYSDSDFKIEWEGVKQLQFQSNALIYLSTGRKYVGRIRSASDTTAVIKKKKNIDISIVLKEVVWINPLEERFIDRLSFNVDFGSSLTRSQNLRQFTFNSGMGYRAKKWTGRFTYTTLSSSQDDTEDIRRSDGSFTFNYFLPRSFYISLSSTSLSNTEQRLNLRINAKGGLGKYLIRTNRSYWGVGAGLNRNIENFSNETPDRDSWEVYIGSELDLYDIGDLNLSTTFAAYPSITENGRWRIDYKLDFMYDLPFDLYIKLNLTLNFDNQPASDANELDYVFGSGIGWEL